MKYQCEVTIDLPRDRVVELFDSSENLPKWQPGLLSFDHVSGKQGQSGAKSRLVYVERGRETEMFETIIRRNMPEEFTALYEAKGVTNWCANFFKEDGSDKTLWVMKNEFKFHGLMSIFGLVMRGAFPKQTLSDMNRFKAFAEGVVA